MYYIMLHASVTRLFQGGMGGFARGLSLRRGQGDSCMLFAGLGEKRLGWVGC
jgi:hypothetical protein